MIRINIAYHIYLCISKALPEFAQTYDYQDVASEFGGL